MAAALTFDNLGEAADLERGVWPPDAPLGRHPSVTVVLPKLLDALAAPATFFVEALNCELYPDAVGEIAARGHAVGMHGWRHERWDALDPDREAQLLGRGRAAFAALNLEPTGFRPPGGALTAASAELLADHGFTWCSPEAGWAGPTGALERRPFRWPHVDAYWRLHSFADLRRRRGDPDEPRPWGEVTGRLQAATDMVVLHPFLMADDEGWSAATSILARHDRSPHA